MLASRYDEGLRAFYFCGMMDYFLLITTCIIVCMRLLPLMVLECLMYPRDQVMYFPFSNFNIAVLIFAVFFA